MKLFRAVETEGMYGVQEVGCSQVYLRFDTLKEAEELAADYSKLPMDSWKKAVHLYETLIEDGNLGYDGLSAMVDLVERDVVWRNRTTLDGIVGALLLVNADGKVKTFDGGK